MYVSLVKKLANVCELAYPVWTKLGIVLPAKQQQNIIWVEGRQLRKLVNTD